MKYLSSVHFSTSEFKVIYTISLYP